MEWSDYGCHPTPPHPRPRRNTHARPIPLITAETLKALAAILLGAGALGAVSHLVDWIIPPPPLAITVHLDAPLTVRPRSP